MTANATDLISPSLDQRERRGGRVAFVAFVAVVVVAGAAGAWALTQGGSDPRATTAVSPFAAARNAEPLPPDAAQPAFVAHPLRSLTLEYTVAELGPESGDDKGVTHAPQLEPAVTFRTIIDSDGNFVEKSLDAKRAVEKDYSDGELNILVDGSREGGSVIDPKYRPYPPRLELTQYGAAFIAEQESIQNAAAAKSGHSSATEPTSVDCSAATACVQVVYTRQREIDAAEQTLASRVGLNDETSVLVYEPATLLIHYYRSDVNGKTVHEFRLTSKN